MKKLFSNGNSLLVKFEDSNVQIRSYRCFDMMGRTLLLSNSTITGNKLEIPLHFNAGVHVLQLNTNKGSVSVKWLNK